MHIWYQYNVTKSHKIIKYHPVSPSCHPLVIPPCTQVMNIYVIPLIRTCRFPGQVMPLQQPSAGDGTGLGVPSAGDNVPEQGTSPEQGHHNLAPGLGWNNGLQFQDLAFQALAIELGIHKIQLQDLAFQALAIELRHQLQFQDLAFQALAIELRHQLQFQDLAFQALAIEFVSVPRKGLNKNLSRSWQVHTYTSLSFSKLWEFIRNNYNLEGDFFHILIFTNELDDYMHSFFCLVRGIFGAWCDLQVFNAYTWLYSYTSSGLHAPTIRFPNVVVGMELHRNLNTDWFDIRISNGRPSTKLNKNTRFHSWIWRHD